MIFNLKEVGLIALIVFAGALVLELGANAFSKDERIDSEPKMVEVADTSLSFSTGKNEVHESLWARFELLQPAKKKEQNAAVTEPVIVQPRVDKTLRPNFRAFDEDHQIGLAGIFTGDKTFAVLQIVNYQTKQMRFEKVALGEHIGRYQVIQVENNSVSLNGVNDELVLTLFEAKNKG